MTGTLMPCLAFRAVDSSGFPLSGALLQFYVTGTTTPTPVYTDKTLGTPLSNPVVADSGGLFPPIFADPNVVYRAILKRSDSSVVIDIDPAITPIVNGSGSITAPMLATGVAVSNLGFTPLNAAGDSPYGEIILNYSMSVPPDIKSVGFRGMPMLGVDAIHTFGPDESGKMIRHSDGSAYPWTIPPQSSVNFARGTVIAIRNGPGAGVITLTRGSGVTLAIVGNGTNQNVAVAAYGFGAIVKEFDDLWFWSGTGGS